RLRPLPPAGLTGAPRLRRAWLKVPVTIDRPLTGQLYGRRPDMDISPDQVRKAIISLIAFVLSVAVHEFGHAWMANRLGDRIPASQGRLTLSPLAHIDLVGTILMPLIGALMPGGFPLIAWGKPVQTNPASYTSRLSRRTGHLLVSLAGPMMNLLLAVI